MLFLIINLKVDILKIGGISMLPYINILGIVLPTYGMLAFIGIAVAICFGVFYFSKFHNIKREDIFYASMFALIGAGIGAKLLYIITILPDIIKNFDSLNWQNLIPRLLQGGFVFYGGLIGGALGVYIYSKSFKISFRELCNIFISVIPIFHAIGRIGCLLAGCCYGREYNGFGSIIFYNTQMAPVGIPLFPMQIVESICNLIIFIIIIGTYKKFKGTYKTIAIYAVLYSIVRFVLEFYRGDEIRGIKLFSTSQWISIVLFVVGIALFIYDNKKNNRITKFGNKI